MKCQWIQSQNEKEPRHNVFFKYFPFEKKNELQKQYFYSQLQTRKLMIEFLSLQMTAIKAAGTTCQS